MIRIKLWYIIYFIYQNLYTKLAFLKSFYLYFVFLKEAQFLEWIYKSEKESSALFDMTNDDIGIPIKKDLLASAEVILELEEYIYEALIRGELDLNSLPKILSENKGKISNLNLNDNFDSISIKSPDFFNGEPIDAIQNDINIFHQKNTATLKKLLQICEPHIPFEHRA